eukprot:1152183-Pelagomonas_calceolata.AAC.2
MKGETQGAANAAPSAAGAKPFVPKGAVNAGTPPTAAASPSIAASSSSGGGGRGAGGKHQHHNRASQQQQHQQQQGQVQGQQQQQGRGGGARRYERGMDGLEFYCLCMIQCLLRPFQCAAIHNSAIRAAAVHTQMCEKCRNSTMDVCMLPHSPAGTPQHPQQQPWTKLMCMQARTCSNITIPHFRAGPPPRPLLQPMQQQQQQQQQLCINS